MRDANVGTSAVVTSTLTPRYGSGVDGSTALSATERRRNVAAPSMERAEERSMTVGVRSLLLLAHRFGAQFHFLRGHRKQFRIVESARRARA